MLANSSQYTSNIIDLTIPDEPRPGEHITYARDGRLFSGIVWGTITTEVKRHKIDGKYPVVVEYIVEADAGQAQPWTFVTVYEGDVVWTKPVKPVCPRCSGERIIGIVGDNAIDCPECGFVDEWKVF